MRKVHVIAALTAASGAGADGAAVASPGAISGNQVQVQVSVSVSVSVSVPVNARRNSVNVIGVLNPAFGNRCANTGMDDGMWG